MDDDTLAKLAQRLGPERLKKRLTIQAHMEQANWPHRVTGLRRVQNTLPSLLRPLGLLARGQANALDIRQETNCIASPHLPAAFHGLRLLHLSDLHLDSMADNGQHLRELVAGIECDLCVITGDVLYAPDAFPAQQEQMRLLAESLCPSLGTYAVLGNHDHIETVPWVESLGIRVLLNEGVTLTRGEDVLYLAGVDDPEAFATHDVGRALADRISTGQEHPFTIFLCHSPTLAAETQTHSVDLYLCGHTHGGQICLPGGIPIITKTACPRWIASGSWQIGKMAGYTSRGAGSALPAVRFHCPPEVTMHILTQAP
jgi:uncharacterized protein